MVKRTYVDGDGLRKGAWTYEEDDKLRAYVNRHGHSNWRLLPRFAGLDRCGKSCRLRWMNYLKPGVRRGGYSDEERDLITRLHHQHGNKWSIMSSKLPGRTDNEIKNFYNAHMKKRLKAAPLTEKAEVFSSGGTDLVTPAAPKLPSSELFIQDSIESNSTVSGIPCPVELGSDSSMERNCSDASSISSGATGIDDNGFSDLLFPGFDDEFWTQPFMVDTDSYDGCDVFSSSLCMWLNDVNNSIMLG